MVAPKTSGVIETSCCVLCTTIHRRSPRKCKKICFSKCFDTYNPSSAFDTKCLQAERDDSPPRTVDLVRLEKVLEKAPHGLHIPEAVKAKKTATRYLHRSKFLCHERAPVRPPPIGAQNNKSFICPGVYRGEKCLVSFFSLVDVLGGFLS